MTVFLDANIAIYYVEGQAVFGPQARSRINGLFDAGDRVAVTDLIRMECLVVPLRTADQMLLTRYDTFFSLPDMTCGPLTRSLCDRAAQIRASYGFRPFDSLHLAAAVEFECERFLTNDARLVRFPDIAIEILSP